MLASTQIKTAAALLLVTGVLAGVGVEATRHAAAEPPPPATRPAAAPVAAGPLRGVLSNGIAVELLGMGESPSAGRPWWHADGGPAAAPYDHFGATIGLGPTTLLPREVAYRVTRPEPFKDADVAFTVEGANSFGGGNVVDAKGADLPDIDAMKVHLPDQPATVHFSVAAGPWVTLADLSVDKADANADMGDRGHVAALKPFPVPGHNGAATSAQTEVVITGHAATLPEQRRVLALSADGHMWVGRVVGEGSTDAWQTITVRFDGAAPADVATLIYQTRAYDQFIAFKNVAVHAGQVTQPTVTTADNFVPTQAPATAASHADFPHAIDVRVDQSHFAAGDAITVTDIHGTAADLQHGICRISGTYTLASHEKATLAASVTARDAADGRGNWNDAQRMAVAKGSGAFTLLLPIGVRGWPHVSFYGAGDSFGGVYLGDATTGTPPGRVTDRIGP